MRYVIESKPNLRVVSKGCGDYFQSGNTTFIDVKEQKNKDSEFLVCLHEILEEYLTRRDGIKEEDITDFDTMFEKEREEGKHDEFAEPGEDIRAPYREQHLFAEYIERLVCEKMGLDWDKYNKELEV